MIRQSFHVICSMNLLNMSLGKGEKKTREMLGTQFHSKPLRGICFVIVLDVLHNSRR